MIRLAAAFCLVASGAAACAISPVSYSPYPESEVFDLNTKGPIARAWFDDAVNRYDHGILGRATEPAALWVDATGNFGICGHKLVLDAAHVFEDVAPRLADLDGDGTNEVIVVRTHLGQGAQLAVYRWTGSDLVLDATTPYIGRRHRWLAPVGVADLDGDGAMDLAYIDRPHLARTLRIWRYADGKLTQIAAADGLTNHRIGDNFISGGIRNCGEGPEIVTADARWTRMIATRLEDELQSREVGPYRGQPGFDTALACR